MKDSNKTETLQIQQSIRDLINQIQTHFVFRSCGFRFSFYFHQPHFPFSLASSFCFSPFAADFVRGERYCCNGLLDCFDCLIFISKCWSFTSPILGGTCIPDKDMVQTLQSIKGGGGSIKVGATGTISSLMMRELESMKSCPKSVTTKNKSKTTAIISSVASTPKKLQRKSLDEASSGRSYNIASTPKRLQRKSFDEASSDRSYNSVGSRSLGNSHNTKTSSRNVHRMPMLGSNDIHMDGNSGRDREKPERKGLRAVEIVDVRCNNPDRSWASRPLSNRLRKLGFSKLSETFA